MRTIRLTIEEEFEGRMFRVEKALPPVTMAQFGDTVVLSVVHSLLHEEIEEAKRKSKTTGLGGLIAAAASRSVVYSINSLDPLPCSDPGYPPQP